MNGVCSKVASLGLTVLYVVNRMKSLPAPQVNLQLVYDRPVLLGPANNNFSLLKKINILKSGIWTILISLSFIALSKIKII